MNRPDRLRAYALPAAAVALLLLAGACGNDDDDAQPANGSTAPVKIMTWAAVDNPNASAPQVRTAAQAAIDAINESDALTGRLIDLTFCDTKFDPNTEAGCARRAVAEGFDAVVGSTTYFPNTLPLLERAGVPYIGGQGLTPAELTNPISFPLASGIPGWFQGAATMVVQRGATKPAIVVSDLASSQFGGQQLAAGLQRHGVNPVRTVNTPVGAPDQSVAAAQAADGTDAVLIAAAPVDAVKVVQSLRQADYTGMIASATAIFSKDALPTLGPAAEGLLLTTQVAPVTDEANDAITEFVDAMDADDAAASKDERSLTTWTAMQLTAQVINRIDGDVSAELILQTMQSLDDPIDTGLAGGYAVASSPSPLADFPRIYNPTIVFTEVRAGQPVRTTPDYVNPFLQPTGASYSGG